MSKYILFNASNKISSRYDSAINTSIPTEAIEVSDEVFFQTINEQDGEWTLVGADVVKQPFPAPSSAELVAAKITEINAAYTATMESLTASYPASEVLSWNKQETEARAFLADALAPTPLLDGLALARGLAKTELVTRIITKADLFAQYSGATIGKRQGLEDQIAALGATPTKAQLDLITW